VEEEREPHGLRIDAGKYNLRHGPHAKERLAQLLLGRDDLVRQVFKFRKLADEPQDAGDLMLLNCTHAHSAIHARQPVLCRP
jgi:hypothetical protein